MQQSRGSRGAAGFRHPGSFAAPCASSWNEGTRTGLIQPANLARQTQSLSHGSSSWRNGMGNLARVAQAYAGGSHARQAMVVFPLVPLCPSQSMTSVAAMECLVASGPEKGQARPRRRDCEVIANRAEPGKSKNYKEYAMAKRKKSTFERLQRGSLNRKQRKELERRFHTESPELEIVHPNAAGIDIGNESHFVSVPPGQDQERCASSEAGQRIYNAWPNG